MNISIKARQWLWFVGLWVAGFMAMFLLTLPIKALIWLAS